MRVFARLGPCVSLGVLLFFGCDSGPRPPSAAALAASQEIADRFGVAAVPPGGLSIESPYSRIEVRERGTRRTLYFVSEDGRSFPQAESDLARPQSLVLPYTRGMFLSYLFNPDPANALLVGLGAGSMVRFLDRFDPDLRLDAIDIDPEIVRIAKDYFGTRESDRVRLLTADGYRFIREGDRLYDLIFMDAFLEPSDETGPDGVPLALMEESFYVALRDRLTPVGVVVFNLHPDHRLERRIADIAKIFPQVYRFELNDSINRIVVATRSAKRLDAARLEEGLQRLDGLELADFSFVDLVSGDLP